ncbi:MAG TPA: hypothetical protein VD883_00190 [Candidatus Omnitrophota bacterium]|nr:hypothetical protein [Candidatus Omnitrophota bacterium]
MADNAEKIQVLTHIVSKIKNTEHSNQAVIKQLAELQMELTTAGLDAASQKIGGIFSQASQSEEGLKSLAGDLDIEINKLKLEK